MIVSWNWLKQYVPLDMPSEELERRLMMAGLNHEGTEDVAGDLAIDFEVTSNRPDCLGHIGIAREMAVLWGRELKLPPANPPEEKTPVEKLVKCADRLPRSLSALHRPGRSRRENRPQPVVDGPAAEDRRHYADQQRGGHQQLRVDGVRPAAAHVRLWPARRKRGQVHFLRQRGPVPLSPGRRSSFAGRCRAKRSRPSTTRPTCSARKCA